MSAPATAQAYGRLATLPAFKAIIALPKALRSDTVPENDPSFQAFDKLKPATKPKQKSFQLHIGGSFVIPHSDATAKPLYSHPEVAEQSMHDPFSGIPFRRFAEDMGERIFPAIEATREEQRRSRIESRAAADATQPHIPSIPHILPLTRWASQNDTLRSTFVVENSKTRKKARLSWYHPDDSMVPRGWWQGGLLADMKYYNPFNILSSSTSSSSSEQTVAAATAQ